MTITDEMVERATIGLFERYLASTVLKGSVWDNQSADIQEFWRDCARAALAAALQGWQPIETAPKDGTLIDLCHNEFGRHSDCYWGRPDHVCGEAGQYCDSDWHGLAEGWVCGSFNEPLDAEDFTHWMPLAAAPAAPQDSTP